MSNIKKEITPEYVYVTIPAEYVCVYHRILAMLADYGEDMLKDCKAACKDRNSGVIECFNMFNAAVAARKLGKQSEADCIIKYIKAKINQIYKDKDNSTSFVFPVDETGELKAFVSCGERPRFFIDSDNGELYEHKLNNGFPEHFKLGEEDGQPDATNVVATYNAVTSIPATRLLNVILVPKFETVDGIDKPCADIIVTYKGYPLALDNIKYKLYINDVLPVIDFTGELEDDTVYKFSCIVEYNNLTVVKEEWLRYENRSN